MKIVQCGAIALALSSGLLMANQATQTPNVPTSPVEDVRKLHQSLDYDLDARNHYLRVQRIEHYLKEAQTHHDTKWYRQRDEALRLATSIIEHHQNSLDDSRSGISI